MKKLMRNTALLVLLGAAVSACGTPQAYKDLKLKARNGFQDMTLEVSPAVSNAATIDDLRLEANRIYKHNFDVLGYVAYGKSCKVLTLDAKFYREDGSVLGTARAMLQNYVANDRTKFRASFMNMPSTREELLSKAVIDGIKCI